MQLYTRTILSLFYLKSSTLNSDETMLIILSLILALYISFLKTLYLHHIRLKLSETHFRFDPHVIIRNQCPVIFLTD